MQCRALFVKATGKLLTNLNLAHEQNNATKNERKLFDSGRTEGNN